MLSITNAGIANRIETLIADNPVFIFAKSTCPHCKAVKQLFDSMKIQYAFVDLDLDADGSAILEELKLKTGQRTVPNVFVRNLHIGTADNTKKLVNDKTLARLFDPPSPVAFIPGDAECGELPKVSQEFDLIVIGGGSGGNACVKEATKLGAKCCVLDFVKPSPQGTTWGYGGTCVNVGCIPKKLMHQAALIKEYIRDSQAFGYDIDAEKVNCDWAKLVSAVGDHIHSLNFNYKTEVRRAKAKYINAYAEFVDDHILRCVDAKGNVTSISGEHIVIAVGGRPKYPGIPGDKEYGITSDDLFWLTYHPQKTLIVGASYIALECAGFLNEVGCDVTIMVRSIFLRGFDQQIADKIGGYIEKQGVSIMRTTIPKKIEQMREGKPGQYRVHFVNAETGEEGQAEFNTIIFAIGRQSDLSDLHLERTGVLQSPMSGKVITMNEATSVKHIYALGDCVKENRQPLSADLELTPVAIKVGQAIARKLFHPSEQSKVDYNFVPTTVFTPVEYGCVGLSEDMARHLYKERVEVYHTDVLPFEWTVPHREADVCYIKLVVLKGEEPGPEHELVIGFHYFGPYAGEVTQGFALALKKNATKADFDNLVGIHPTTAESFTKMTITKSSGADSSASGC